MEPNDSELKVADRDEPLQFSLRTLLLFMTLVSVVLAIGVHFAGFLFALIALGLIQAAMLLGADWLIRPAHRRALALVTAASWTVAGSGLILLGVSGIFTASNAIGWVALPANADRLSTGFAGGLMAIGAICYLVAIRRWRQLSGPISQ